MTRIRICTGVLLAACLSAQESRPTSRGAVALPDVPPEAPRPAPLTSPTEPERGAILRAELDAWNARMTRAQPASRPADAVPVRLELTGRVASVPAVDDGPRPRAAPARAEHKPAVAARSEPTGQPAVEPAAKPPGR